MLYVLIFNLEYSGPYAKIEMRSGEIDGYDAVFLSTHKFLGGPGSPGILLMSKALYRLGSSPPSTCGGGTVNFVNSCNEEASGFTSELEISTFFTLLYIDYRGC